MSLDTSTGSISGTPTAVTSSATYTITATNTGGTDTATMTIVVNDIAPAITYSPNSLTLTKGTAMTTITVTSTGGAVVSYSVSPSLPSGLSLDTSTGAISGTPTAITSSASYTITATNTGGTDTATVTIVVNDLAPSSVTYSSKLTYTDQRYNDVYSYPNNGWRNSHILVDFTIPTSRVEFQQHNWSN